MRIVFGIIGAVFLMGGVVVAAMLIPNPPPTVVGAAALGTDRDEEVSISGTCHTDDTYDVLLLIERRMPIDQLNELLGIGAEMKAAPVAPFEWQLSGGSDIARVAAVSGGGYWDRSAAGRIIGRVTCVRAGSFTLGMKVTASNPELGRGNPRIEIRRDPQVQKSTAGARAIARLVSPTLLLIGAVLLAVAAIWTRLSHPGGGKRPN